MDSISDATGLYEEYFGQAFHDANLDHDKQLQITAGIIAFLGSIHLDYLEPIRSVLYDNKMDASSFKDCVYMLHEMEFADICHDKAVAISDQCFSNFILKYVFCDKKTVSLSKMIDVCFETFRERTVYSVNTLFDVFRTEDTRSFVAQEIREVWKKRKKESGSDFWGWVKAFYPIYPEETLLLIKERIDNTEQNVIPINSIDVNKGKNYISVSDELIEILCGFANTDNIDSALDLFFEYYLKRPDLFMEFYHAITQYFGIDTTAVKNDYQRIIHLIDHFINYSNNWNNEYVRLLFFQVAYELLQVYFSPYESNRRTDAIIIYQLALRPSQGAFLYREKIWEQLLAIQKGFGCSGEIKILLSRYAKSIEECSFEIIERDAPFLEKLIVNCLSEDNVNDCILANQVASAFELAHYKSGMLEKYLKSEKYLIYRLLAGQWNFQVPDFDENENEQKIKEYLSNAENVNDSFDKLFQIYSECSGESALSAWEIETGFYTAVSFMVTNAINCKYAVEKQVLCQKINTQAGFDSIRSMFIYYSPDIILSILNNAPKETKDYWLYIYYHEFPEYLISIDTVQNFYKYLHSEYDRDLLTHLNRDLKFLAKYEKIDSNIFINTVLLIFDKRKYSAAIVHDYIWALFNEHCYNPLEVINKFRDHLDLLEEIYIFESLNDNLTDYSGSMLKEICEIHEDFAVRYYEKMYAAKTYHRTDDSIRLQKLLLCQNNMSIIDSVVNECIMSSHSFYMHASNLINNFVDVAQDLIEKSDKWVRHFIREYNQDVIKMQTLFDSISLLTDENRKTSYVYYLVECNDDPELFEKIELTPVSYSWTGSGVPIYSGWIEYLSRLSALFTGIRYLKHRDIISKKIERLRKLTEETEIQDVLRG